MLRQAVADTLAQGSLAYAAGQNLDHIGITYYSLVRLGGEGDDRYRERLSAAFERYAVGLSGPWYESIARAVAGVADARVTTPVAGTVRIFVLGRRGARGRRRGRVVSGRHSRRCPACGRDGGGHGRRRAAADGHGRSRGVRAAAL